MTTYFVSIFLGTFALEDLALVSALTLMNEGKISFQTAFWACFLGISIGDLGLYFIGSVTAHLKIDQKISFFKKHRATLNSLQRSKALTYSIVISRLIPGTRLPTYIAAGFLKYPFLKFFLLTLASVFAWVLIAFLGGQTLHSLFMDRWLLNLILFIFFLQTLKSLIPKLMDHWQRKALLFSWRKWLYFEFWPAWFFYIPIVPLYIWLSIKHRSFFMPFYASPFLKHGGLIGESKWDLLQHLSPKDSSTLKALKISKDLDLLSVRKMMDENGFEYPIILKPDVGQRGFGVRILRDDFDLTEYLLLSSSDLILQRFSEFTNEAGVFYVRKPSEAEGILFSITDKKFPFVTGDGRTKLGDLILKDRRAQIIAPVYFARLQKSLDSVPENGEIIPLSECGNHCQGAIFLNGSNFATEKLRREIDRLAKKIPDFYFGRLDIRYRDPDSLRLGRGFEIVEINGSGSEATHIWDAKTKLVDAYRTLFIQWTLLFEIGAQVKKLPHVTSKVHFGSFLKDSAKVIFRKESLSVSS